MNKTEKIKKMLTQKREKRQLTYKDFVGTGSTLLNLACTGNPYRGFAKGKYYFIVGDSVSGKTFLSLTCLAEASMNPNFDDYRFIYDNAEDGALMDIEKFFGKKVFERMEPPKWLDSLLNEPAYSSTIEEFYYHVDDAIKIGRPFIYILDSMDSLSSQEESGKFAEQKTAYRTGREVAGTYGISKAKENSAKLRRVLTPLRDTGSILIIINQTRDNIGFGFERKTRSGGHALRFYATIEMWSSVKRKISRNVMGKKRQLGVECLIQIKKNRITGREWNISIPIYHSFGIDDIGSCVDYLIDEGYWQRKGNTIKAPEMDFTGHKEKLIRHIEKGGLEKDLREMVGDVWTKVGDKCSVKRKRRYE